MNIRTLVDRIAIRCRELGLSETELSRAIGSKETIRNWRRAANAGKDMSPQMKNIEQVAALLDTSVGWLTGASDSPTATTGFAEPTVEPFRFSEPVLGDILTRFIAPDARACDTYRASESFPGFAVARGDLIVTELGGGQQNGDIVVVTMTQDHTSETTLRRLVGNWLVAEDPSQPPEPANPNDGRIGIVATVRGIVRRSKRPA
jgi:transcriptional regulator with XRE-family HTH domain